MMFFADLSRGRPCAKDPAVVFFAGRYLMYYSICAYGDGRPGDGFGVGIAESSDLDNWTRIGEVPRLTELEKEKGFCAPGAIVLGDVLHLFYQSYGGGPKDAICHATSRDGVHFEPDPTNPIFRPTGAWNCGRAIDADVIVSGERLLLYVATRDPEFKIQKLAVAAAHFHERRPVLVKWLCIGLAAAAGVFYECYYPVISCLPVAEAWVNALRILPSWMF